MIELHGQSAIITGGGSGIGMGIAKVLSIAGVSTLLVDRNFEGVQEVSDALLGNHVPYKADVTEQRDVERMVSFAIDTFGKIDILVNNAGIVGASNWWERDIPNDDDWDQVHSVNVRAIVRVTQAVSDHMKLMNYGKIVNIASIAGRRGSPDLPHYSTTKAAVISWTQSSALQLAEFGINVNAICPGLLWTPMWEAIAKRRTLISKGSVSKQDGRDFFEKIVQDTIPMKREQTPEDIGNLCAFLVSDLAHNITGQAINVDGGRFSN